MAASPSRDAVIAALSTVRDPELHRDIVSLGMVKDVAIADGRVRVEVELTTPACPLRETIERDVRAALARVEGIAEVLVEFSANVRATAPRSGQQPVEGVRNIIAIASNKGGVGKSTVATNLSVALAKTGARVGLVDADITGPNIPTMFGFPAGILAQEHAGLRPLEKYGVKVISIGFLVPKGTPVVWRGPMIGSAVRQLLHDVAWGDLDYLVIDLPPGTSDAPMTMAQQAPITGAIIVSTPQAVSLEDAAKAVTMFEKLGVPVFGIVENMSYFIAPDTGNRYDIFGHGGAREAAEELGIDFLAEIPLEIPVREGGDRGEPIVITQPDSASARAFDALARTVAARISVLQRMAV